MQNISNIPGLVRLKIVNRSYRQHTNEQSHVQWDEIIMMFHSEFLESISKSFDIETLKHLFFFNRDCIFGGEESRRRFVSLQWQRN